MCRRIKRRFSGETRNLPPASCVSSPPPRRGRTKVGVSLNTNDQGLTTNPSYNSQLASCTLQPVLEIDIHRPDRIIFEGKKVKVTTIGFSLIYLLAQHSGQVVGYEEILKELWEDETDAIYTRINYHICKIKKDILKALNNKSRYAKKIGNIFKIVPGRGLMLDIKEKELETNS